MMVTPIHQVAVVTSQTIEGMLPSTKFESPWDKEEMSQMKSSTTEVKVPVKYFTTISPGRRR